MVVGIGNPIMCDDGLGGWIIQYLQRHYIFPPYVSLHQGGTSGLDMLPMLEGVKRLILVDAVDNGEDPGTLVRLSPQEVPAATSSRLSSHQIGLQDLLALARSFGLLPDETIILGMQPRSIGLGATLSPAATAQLTQLADEILHQLTTWGVSYRAAAFC